MYMHVMLGYMCRTKGCGLAVYAVGENMGDQGSNPSRDKKALGDFLPICLSLVEQRYLGEIVEVSLSWSRHHCYKKKMLVYMWLCRSTNRNCGSTELDERVGKSKSICF